MIIYISLQCFVTQKKPFWNRLNSEIVWFWSNVDGFDNGYFCSSERVKLELKEEVF